MKIFISVFLTSIFWIVCGLVIKKHNPSDLPVPESPVVLKSISEEERNFYKSKYVTINAGGLQGSGCEYKPGYFLTALHVLIPAILDGDTIAVDGKKASVVAQSKTREDYAIVSTYAEIEHNNDLIPEHDFKEGEDVVIVGSPGNQVALVQPGKIINTVVLDEKGVVKKSAKKVYTIYVEKGISGGCVYPVGSKNPVAVFTMKEADRDSHIGEISLTSKVGE